MNKRPGPTEILLLIFATTGALIGFIWSYVDEQAFRTYMVPEDGFTEWATVFAFVLILIVSVRRFLLLRSKREPRFLAMVILIACLSFFAIGEELSWGQRFIGWESPEFFDRHNAQKETNLHNLEFFDIKVNKAVFGRGLGILLLVYLFFIGPAYRFNAAMRNLIDRYAIPIASNYQVVAYLAFVILLEVIMTSSKRGEMLEFALSFMFLLTVAYPLNSHIFSAYKERE